MRLSTLSEQQYWPLTAAVYLLAVHGALFGQVPERQVIALQTILAPSTVTAPQEGNSDPVTFLLALKVTNISGSSLLLNKLQMFEVSLEKKDGALLTAVFSIDMSYRPTFREFELLEPKESGYLISICRIRWVHGQLSLTGSSVPGETWRIRGLEPGRYKLRLRYHPTNKGLANTIATELNNHKPWVGDIVASTVDLVIKKNSGVGGVISTPGAQSKD